MTRRANLPGADELFRSTAPALSAVPAQSSQEVSAPLVPPAIATPKAASSKKGVRTIARRRVTTVDRGRIVRESIAVIIADLEAKGDQSILARRLRGQ